jgi:hypothetical protein
MGFGMANDIKIIITADSQNAQTNIKQVLGQLGAAPGQIRNISNATLSWKNAMAGVVGLFSIWRTFDFLGRQAKEFVNIASELEKLDIAVVRFSESSEHARVRFEWINEMGQKAYGIRTLEQALVQLEHVGIKNAAGGLEGLIGYLHQVGKTGPEALSGVVNKMTELYQLGNIGMDDALKELNEKVPFTMQAVRSKLKIGMAQLIGEFRQSNMDFATIIKAVLEYAEENFKDGLTKMAGTWDVLFRQLGYKYEFFVRNLEQNGVLQTGEKILKGIMDDLNRLAQNGKFEEWAKGIAESVDRMGKAFGGGSSAIETGGDIIVGFLEGVSKFTTQTFETWAPALRAFSAAVKNLWDTYEAAPDWLKEGTGNTVNSVLMGALAGRLFGPGGAAVGSMIGLGLSGMKNSEEFDRQTTPPGFIPRKGGIPGQVELEYPITTFQSDWLGTFDSHETRVDQAVEKLDWMEKWNAGIEKAFKEAEQAKMADRVTKLYATSPDDSGNLAEGELMNFQKFMATHAQFKTQLDKFREMDAKGGLSGFDRLKTDATLEYEKALKQNDEMKKSLEKMLEGVMKTGDPERIKEAKDTIAIVDKERDELGERYRSYIEKEAVRWEAKQAGKDAKKLDANLVDVADIDHFARSIRAVITESQEAFRDLDQEFEQQQATTAGSVIKAQELAIDQQMDALKKKFNANSEKIHASYTEMMEKLTGGEHHGSQAAMGLKAEMDAMLFGSGAPTDNDAFDTGSFEELVRNYMAKLEEQRAALKGRLQEPFKLQADVNMAKLQLQQTELTGTMEQQFAARVKLIGAETRLGVLQAEKNGATGAELELMKQIGQQKQFVEQQTANGTWYAGWLEGLRQLKNEVSTTFQNGAKGAQLFASSLNKTADSLTELAMTGKMNFADLANSIIRDTIRMMIQILFVDRILKATFGWFGGTTPTATPVSSVPGQYGKTVTAAAAESMGIRQDVSDAGRFRSSEYPAVARREEGSGRKSGSSVQIDITVPVQVGGAGGGGVQDVGHAKEVGSVIGRHIKAEVYTTIRELMRPGGMLNAEFSG